MSKVFIIEHPRKHIDLSKATNFGELVYIFDYEDRRCSIFDSVEFGRTMLDNLRTLKYNSDEDYVCVVGSLLPISIFMIVLAHSYDNFNLLLFDSVHDTYVRRKFNKSNWKGQENGVEDTTTLSTNQCI